MKTYCEHGQAIGLGFYCHQCDGLANAVELALQQIAPNYLRVEFAQDGHAYVEVIAQNGRKVICAEDGSSLRKALLRALMTYNWGRSVKS